MGRSGQTEKPRRVIRFDKGEVVLPGLTEEIVERLRRSRQLRIDQTGTKPLLLLDVDGVLCPVNLDVTGFTLNTELKVMIGDDHRERLAALSELFELVWATLWEHRANTELAEVLGLEMLPVIEFDSTEDDGVWDDERGCFVGGSTFKLKAIEAAAGNRPLAWVDDEIGEDAHRWARERDLAGVPTFFLQTKTEQGLTDDDFARLVAFGERCQQLS
jgi:hypothetical protein